MATDTCISSLGLGFNPVPIGFHCAFCNVSFKKRKFLKIHCGGLFHRDRLILMKTASCVDESSSLIETDKDDCSSLNKLVTLHHSSDCSKRGTPNSSDSVTTESENDKPSISQEASGEWKNSLCVPGITAGFGNSVQSTPENYRLTSDSLVDKNQKLDDRNHSSLNNVSLSHDDTTFISKLKNAAEVKESFSCKLCRIQTSDRNSLNNHTSSLEHCKLFVLRQNELGMEEFKKQFGDVPFTRILSENIPAPPDDFDPNMTRIYQSAVVNDLLCHACDRQCKTLEEWFQHIYDPSHCQKLNWLHGTHGVFLFLALYGNLPLPESFMPMSVSDGMPRAADVLENQLERSETKSTSKDIKLPEYMTVFDYNFENISGKSDYENNNVEKISAAAADEDLFVDRFFRSTPKSNIMHCSFKIIDHNFESEKKESELSTTTEEAACSKPFANTDFSNSSSEMSSFSVNLHSSVDINVPQLPEAFISKSSCDSHLLVADMSTAVDEAPCESKHSDNAEAGFSCLSKSNCSETKSVDSGLLVVDKVLEKVSHKNNESLLTDFPQEAAELYGSNLMSESDIVRVCDVSSIPVHIGSSTVKESKLTTTKTLTNSAKSSTDNLVMVSENEVMVSENEVDGMQETEGQAIPVLSSSVHQNFNRSSKSSNRAYKCLREISSKPRFCNENGHAGDLVIMSTKSRYNKTRKNIRVTNIVAVRSQPPCSLANTSPNILGVSSSCDTLIPSSGCLNNSDQFTAYPLVKVSTLVLSQTVSSSSCKYSQSACTYSETPSSSIASDLYKIDGSIHNQGTVCSSLSLSSGDLQSQCAVTASSAISSPSLCFCVSNSLSSVASSPELASCNCRIASFESCPLRESQLVGPPTYVVSKLTNEVNSECKSKSEPIKVDENNPTSVKSSSDNAFVSSAILDTSVQTTNYKAVNSDFYNKVIDVISSSTTATLLDLHGPSCEMKSISEDFGVDIMALDIDRASSNTEKSSSHNDFSISCIDSRCPDPCFSENDNPILDSVVEQSSESMTPANSSRVVSNTVKSEDFDSIQNPLIKFSADSLLSAALTKPMSTNISALVTDMSAGDSLPNIKPVESHEPSVYLGFAIFEESTSLLPSALPVLLCPRNEVENEDTIALSSSAPIFSCPLPVISSNSATKTSVINEKAIPKSKLNSPDKKRCLPSKLRRIKKSCLLSLTRGTLAAKTVSAKAKVVSTSTLVKPSMSVAPVLQSLTSVGTVPCVINSTPVFSCALPSKSSNSAAATATVTSVINEMVTPESGLGNCLSTAIADMPAVSSALVATAPLNVCKVVRSFEGPTSVSGINKQAVNVTEQQNSSKLLGECSSSGNPSMKADIMNRSNSGEAVLKSDKTVSSLDKEQITSKTLKDTCTPASKNSNALSSFTQIGKPRNLPKRSIVSVATSKIGKIRSFTGEENAKSAASVSVSKDNRTASSLIVKEKSSATKCVAESSKMVSPFIQQQDTGKILKGNITSTSASKISKITSPLVQVDCTKSTKIKKGDSTSTCVAEVGNSLSKVTDSEKIVNDCVKSMSETSCSINTADTEKISNEDNTTTVALKIDKTVPPELQENGTKSMFKIKQGGSNSTCAKVGNSLNKVTDSEKILSDSVKSMKDKIQKRDNAFISKTSSSSIKSVVVKIPNKDSNSTADLKPKKTEPPLMQEDGTKSMDKIMKGGNTRTCILKPSSSIKAGDAEKVPSKISTGTTSASQKFYSEKTHLYKKSSPFLSAGSDDRQAGPLFENQFLHKKPNFSSSTSHYSKSLPNCGGSGHFARQQASKLEYLNDLMIRIDQNVRYEQTFGGRMGFQNDSHFDYDDRRGQLLLSAESYYDRQKSFSHKRQFQSFGQGGSPVSKIPYLVQENANYMAQYRDQDYRYYHHFTENRNIIQFMETLKIIACGLQLPEARQKCYSMDTHRFLDSLAYRDRKRVLLISRFIPIENNFALLQAADDLATLDVTLLNQYSELRAWCTDLGSGLGEIMISLLDALWDGHRLHLF